MRIRRRTVLICGWWLKLNPLGVGHKSGCGNEGARERATVFFFYVSIQPVECDCFLVRRRVQFKVEIGNTVAGFAQER